MEHLIIRLVIVLSKNYTVFRLTQWLGKPLSKLMTDPEDRLFVKFWGQL